MHPPADQRWPDDDSVRCGRRAPCAGYAKGMHKSVTGFGSCQDLNRDESIDHCRAAALPFRER